MRGRPRKQLVATRHEIEQLRTLQLSRDASDCIKARSRIILLSLEGMLNKEISRSLEISNSVVGKWRNRFIEDGICGLMDRPRSGRPRAISERQVRLILDRTFRARDSDDRRCSCRSLAAETGIAKSSVQRFLSQLGIPSGKIALSACADSFSMQGEMFPIGVEITASFHAVAVMTCPSKNLASCPHHNGSHHCFGQRFQSFFLEGTRELAKGLSLKGMHDSNLAILKRMESVNWQRCASTRLELIFHASRPQQILELLSWQSHFPNIRLRLMKDVDEWFHAVENLHRFLKSSPISRAAPENLDAITHFFEIELHRAQSDQARNLYWFSQEEVNPVGLSLHRA